MWGELIRICFSRAVIEHGAVFSGVEAGSLLTTAVLIVAPLPGKYPAPLLNICTTIYKWLLGCINPAPLSGNHGPFIGTTTGMVIR